MLYVVYVWGRNQHIPIETLSRLHRYYEYYYFYYYYDDEQYCCDYYYYYDKPTYVHESGYLLLRYVGPG